MTFEILNSPATLKRMKAKDWLYVEWDWNRMRGRRH